mmetsp:Transcript_17622/g.36591  ORF Transcript_17622/g.36591 Transcript_17622/m.36591 type:complete len:201 (-) Transcript_17622:823-1425(-)
MHPQRRLHSSPSPSPPPPLHLLRHLHASQILPPRKMHSRRPRGIERRTNEFRTRRRVHVENGPGTMGEGVGIDSRSFGGGVGGLRSSLRVRRRRRGGSQIDDDDGDVSHSRDLQSRIRFLHDGRIAAFEAIAPESRGGFEIEGIGRRWIGIARGDRGDGRRGGCGGVSFDVGRMDEGNRDRGERIGRSSKWSSSSRERGQ